MLQSIILILIILGMLAVAFFYSRFRMKKALREVIKIFRETDALNHVNAKTKEELGLMPPGLLMRLIGQRDYKPYALQLMIEANIILITEDGRYYLSETKLSSSQFHAFLQ